MKSLVSVILQHSTWTIGDGSTVHLWTDKWLEQPITELWNLPEHMHDRLDMKASEFILNGAWCLPEEFVNRDRALANKICNITLPSDPGPDKLNWNSSVDGLLTNKLAYSFLAGASIQVPWHKLLWNSYIPPSRAFIVWRLIHNKLPTDENLRKRGCYIVSIVASATGNLNLLSIYSLTVLSLHNYGNG